MPFICVGQASIQIGSALDKIYDSFPNGLTRRSKNLLLNNSFITPELLGKDNTGNYLYYQQKFSNWIDGFNLGVSTNGYDQSNELFYKLRCLQEESDIRSNHSNFVLIYDLSSAFSCGMVSALMDQLSSVAPSASKFAVGLKNPHMTGIEAINSLMSLQYSLEYSDALMIRGYDQIIDLCQTSLPSSSKQKPSNTPNIGLEHIHNFIASDLFSAFAPHLRKDSSALPLVTEICHGNKCVDIRSSMWRRILSPSLPYNKTSSITHILSSNIRSDGSERGGGRGVGEALTKTNRALASNLHQLYLAEGGDDVGARPRTISCQFMGLTANCGSGEPYTSTETFSMSRLDESLINQLNPLLAWATPKIDWKTSVTGSTLPDDWVAQYDGREKLSTAGQVPSIHKKQAAADVAGAYDEVLVAFASPFVAESVRCVSDSAERVLRSGAYISRCEEAGLHRDDIYLALESVKMHLDGLHG